ncbi:MAG TPA: AAA family ATPase [Vicinamibacterales bacterium]|nr:AAA family ATPase [Vicinamibacterales bacterium]
MYEAFYGLKERPFELVPNPRFLFLTPRQREALSNLQYGLTTVRGLTLLIGEAGTGKTTLVQAALADPSAATVKVVLMSNPTLTRSEFYEFLAGAFGLTEAAAESKTRFLFELKRELQERFQAGTLSALVIDEAQSIPYELLEEIRLLSNIETTTTKLLNVILAGQPELSDRLNDTSLRQLKQRISLRCQLNPMELNETASYIAGRIRIAGGRPELVFTREAVGAVFQASGGLPRTVNVIADNTLIGGFAAQVKPITAAFVEDVCRDFDIDVGGTAAAAPGSAAAASSLSDQSAAQETPPERAPFVSAPTVPAPSSGEAPALESSVAPMFGSISRKRRFSFF